MTEPLRFKLPNSEFANELLKENQRLNAELELARRVADAAMAIIILDRAITQINIHCANYPDLSASDEEATEILLRASANASFAHASAIREYRAATDCHKI